MRNLAVRQRLLELPDSFLSDLSAAEIQPLKIGHALQMRQPGIRDVLAEDDDQRLDAGQGLQMH